MSLFESITLALFAFLFTVFIGSIAGVILLLLQKHFIERGRKNG